MNQLRELSLYTGVGGGLLGSILLGHKIVGAVEIDSYCCRVLEQRQKDGVLERFPIFNTDIRDFIRSGYAGLYKDCCDIVSGGFPCQPFSVAGKREGDRDSRNMWPATLEVIRQVRPRYCFLENVRGLLSSGYFQEILKDLAESGYDVRWRVLSAAELGAPHRRDRFWIVAADANSQRQSQPQGVIQDKRGWPSNSSQDVADATPGIVAYANGERGQGKRAQEVQRERTLPWGENIGSLEDILRRSDIPKSLICRMDDGFSSRVDRLKAAGNAQVPIVAATAWRLLTEG